MTKIGQEMREIKQFYDIGGDKGLWLKCREYGRKSFDFLGNPGFDLIIEVCRSDPESCRVNPKAIVL